MANYLQELVQDAVCQSHTGHMTGLWFLSAWPLSLNTNEWMYDKLGLCMAIIGYFSALCSVQTRPVICLILFPENTV